MTVKRKPPTRGAPDEGIVANRVYTSTVIDPQHGYSVDIVAIPGAQFDGPIPDLIGPPGIGLPMNPIQELLPHQIPLAIAALLEGRNAVPPSFPTNPPPVSLQFGEYVAFAPVVPIESSPLAGHSLASLATSASQRGPLVLGSVVGFMAASNTSMLLLTVPAGLILCGAGMAFSAWIFENRNLIFNRLFQFRRQ